MRLSNYTLPPIGIHCYKVDILLANNVQACDLTHCSLNLNFVYHRRIFNKTRRHGNVNQVQSGML